MKRLITFGIITVLTIGLTGCSWLQSTEPTTEQPTITEEPDTTPTDVTEPTEEVTTVTGKFVMTAMGASYFDSDDHEMTMTLLSSEVVDKLWQDIMAEVDCPDFHSNATLKVKNITEAEGAYKKYLSVELVEVVDRSKAVCDEV